MSGRDREFDICIIGAGIIGAAVSAAIRNLGSICVLEKNEQPCLETSRNNSGVIHPGFNHPPDSLKAKLCVEGNPLLYEYCSRRNIPHARCGTFVVAYSNDEERSLQSLQANAAELGVELHNQKPPSPTHSTLQAALFAPSGGIVDVPALCENLLSESEASLYCRSRVGAIEYDGTRWQIQTDGQDFRASYLINAAGLYADEISKMAGYPDYTIYPCSGEYYEIESWTAPHLYYPVPHSGTGLGIHLTPTLHGTTLIGPTATYLRSKTDPQRFFQQKDFTDAAEILYPGCTTHPVHIAHRGIRPRLSNDGFSDFVIKKENKPLIQLIGIESPGLTSCLAIANQVRRLLRA